MAARLSTVAFLALSMAIAIQVNSPAFKDIITVVIKWVAGLMGPIAIPFMLGLLPRCRKSGPTAALVSWACGLFAFWVVNYGMDGVATQYQTQYQVSVPLAVSRCCTSWSASSSRRTRPSGMRCWRGSTRTTTRTTTWTTTSLRAVRRLFLFPRRRVMRRLPSCPRIAGQPARRVDGRTVQGRALGHLHREVVGEFEDRAAPFELGQPARRQRGLAVEGAE